MSSEAIAFAVLLVLHFASADVEWLRYITIPGRINHEYFHERLYDGKQKEAQVDAYLQG